MASSPEIIAIMFILVIGRESVLAVSGAREVHCGRRLVSGLFSRPRLPLGYSYVTTVPRGACRLNISEIVPSDNYIALKISNGSYIMNGEFAVSTPGTYEAAGARFLYSRAANRDTVFALGPLQHPIDIMILYTQPNPSIKYEYFTESLPGEIDIESITRGSLPDVHATPPPKHVHRHHTFDSYPRTGRIPNTVSISKEDNEDGFEENIVGSRRFIWKIMSYTQCSRSCGGGFQVGKYRCVETSDSKDKEVSSVHCSGSAPSGRRRRCGTIPCAPRWRSAVWSSCPVCGPAIRTRIVGCVQDHSRGIIKISDQKCPSLKPPTSEPCNIPNCDNTTSENSKHFETKRVIKSREHTDNFQDGPVYTVSVNTSETNLGPKYSFSSVPGWLFTDWSECVGWCLGGGIQTRHVRCADPSGCVPQSSPETLRSCTPKLTCDSHQGQWFTSEWSECTSACGGKQVRGVVCVGGGGRRLRDTACVLPRPQHQRDCDNSKHCAPIWHYSDWGQCAGNCSIGTAVQRRTVLCARVAGGNVGASVDGVASDDECKQARPHARRTCSPNCIASASDNLPLDIPIESQKVSDTENALTNEEPAIEKHEEKDCEDKLSNCGLAVQARLCHYKYYVQNCCQSCHGRL